MDKKQFLVELKDRGYIKTREDAIAAMEKFRSGGGTFDDEQAAVEQPAIQEKQEQTEPTQTEKYGVAGALFPATTKATERGGNFFSRAVAGAGDALTLPARAVSATATGLGTLAGGGGLKQAGREFSKDISRTDSEEKGVLGFAQNMALDPTSSPLIIAAAAPAKVAAAGGKAVPTIGKALLKAGLAGAADATGSALYQQAKEGKISAGQTVGQAALGFGVGAGSAGLGKAVRKGAGKLLKNSAIRNIDISLRPGQYGRKIGYDHDNVVKHDLIGSPRETFEKASTKLKNLQKKAVQIGKNSSEKFKVSDLFNDAKKSLNKERFPEEYADQIRLIENAKKAYIKTFGDVVDAPTAMKIRSRIGDKSAFVGRTAAGAKVDPNADWKEAAYNEIYFKFKNDLHDKLGGELKQINKAQSEIIPVKQVAERRIPISESNQRIGLSDLLTTGIGADLGRAAIGGTVGAGIGAGASEDNRVGGALKGLAIGAALAGGRRALGSPTASKLYYRLGNKLMPAETVGTALTRVGSTGKGKVAKISVLKNEKGAIGGMADEFFGTPAIRDPETGKIYTGGWRGHKDAIVKGENSKIQERLKYQHFLDNTNQNTPNVGFLDDKGNFISRSEAEDIVNQKMSSPSLVSQFHNVGIAVGAGGVAAGGLYLNEKRKNRKTVGQALRRYNGTSSNNRNNRENPRSDGFPKRINRRREKGFIRDAASIRPEANGRSGVEPEPAATGRRVYE
jgi:hypothetical protein